MRARHAAVLLAATLLVACSASVGNADPSVSAGENGSATAPPTRAPGQPESVPGCPNYVIAPETGPVPPDVGENGPIAQAQARISPDIDVAVAYTTEHPDDFGSLRIENVPRVRIVVEFTANLGEHCAALRERLAFPDEFEITWAERTEAEMLKLMDEVTAMAKGHMMTASGGETIELGLRADSEVLAAQIAAKYGPLVDITVGMLHYPDRRLPDGASCQTLRPTLAAGLPLTATVQLASGEIRSGADFRGTVTVQNVGGAPFEFEGGSPEVALVYAGGDIPVGTYVGAIGGVGVGSTLQPGETLPIDLIGGTASCEPSLGYALPPGQYFAAVPVTVILRPNPNAAAEIVKVLSERTPFRVLP